MCYYILRSTVTNSNAIWQETQLISNLVCNTGISLISIAQKRIYYIGRSILEKISCLGLKKVPQPLLRSDKIFFQWEPTIR